MLGRGFWRFGHMLLLVAVIALGAAGLAGAFSSSSTSVALASVAAGGNDNDGDDDNDNEEQRNLEGTVLPVECPSERGSRPDVAVVCSVAEARGVPTPAVLPAVNPGSNPPDMFVHTLDGAVRVEFRDRRILDEYQFQEGDYVRLGGRRVHANLFEADDVESVDRFGGDNDND